MSISPDHDDDKIRFTPGHQHDWEDLEGIPYDDFQPDFEVGAGDGFIESFFE